MVSADVSAADRLQIKPSHQPFVDNVGAIAITANDKLHSRTKHIDIRHHFIRQKFEDKTVLVNYVPTANMLADFLMKSQPSGQCPR